MFKKLGVTLGLMVVSVLAITVLTTHKAAADWCNVIGNPASGSTSRGACLPSNGGQSDANYENLESLSGTALVNQFISDTNANDGSKYPVNSVGANYIEAHLQAYGGSWASNIRGADSVVIANIPNSYACDNTAYDPSSNSVVKDTADCVYDKAMIVYQGGNIVFILRLECGNPVGGLSGLKPANDPPTGSLTVSCTLNGSNQDVYKFTYSFSDADGSSGDHAAGFISSGLYADSDTNNALSNSYDSAGSPYTGDTNTVSYTGAWPGTVGTTYHDVWLRMRDVIVGDTDTWTHQNPNGTNIHVSSSDANCPSPSNPNPQPGTNHLPTGNQTVSCSGSSATISYSFGDADGSSGQTYAFTLIRASNNEPGGTATARDPFDSDALNDATAGNPDWIKVGPGTSTSRTTSLVNGTYSTWLYVKDVGPNAPTGTTGVHGVYRLKGEQVIRCSSAPTCPSTTFTASFPQKNGVYRDHAAIHEYDSGSSGSYEAYQLGSGNSWTYTSDLTYAPGPSIQTGARTFVVVGAYRNTSTVTSSTVYSSVNIYGPVTIGPCGGGGGGGSPSPPPTPTPTPTPTPPPVVVTNNCSNLKIVSDSTGSTTPEPGEGFKVTARYNYPSQAAAATAAASDSYSFAASTLHGTATGPAGLQNNGDGTVTGTYDFTTGLPASGQYNYTVTTSDSPAVSVTCTMEVLLKPYFQAFSGDVKAGVSTPSATTGQTCLPVNTGGAITGWNSDNGALGYAGAGSQYGAEAMGIITGFASAQGAYSDGLNGKGLAFANVSASGDQFGGNYGAALGCDTSYNYGSQTLSGSGTTSIGGTSVPAGQHTQYYRGDVYITDNILYDSTGWTSIADIPNFAVVAVGGNIYIKNTVKEIDGTYVAEPNGATGGNIYTCATSATTAGTSVSYEDCSASQLVVNGSLIANTVYLARTCGTLRQAARADTTTTGLPAGCGTTNHAAEVFNYGPVDWLSQSTVKSTKWDAITSLPPVL